jgi:hypothetical protein
MHTKKSDPNSLAHFGSARASIHGCRVVNLPRPIRAGLSRFRWLLFSSPNCSTHPHHFCSCLLPLLGPTLHSSTHKPPAAALSHPATRARLPFKQRAPRAHGGHPFPFPPGKPPQIAHLGNLHVAWKHRQFRNPRGRPRHCRAPRAPPWLVIPVLRSCRLLVRSPRPLPPSHLAHFWPHGRLTGGMCGVADGALLRTLNLGAACCRALNFRGPAARPLGLPSHSYCPILIPSSACHGCPSLLFYLLFPLAPISQWAALRKLLVASRLVCSPTRGVAYVAARAHTCLSHLPTACARRPSQPYTAAARRPPPIICCMMSAPACAGPARLFFVALRDCGR